MGIDITCAFASESLTAEDGDIYVKFPDILVQHFGWKLDEQRQDRKRCWPQKLALTRRQM